jgi:hypothetical protein
MKKVRRVEYFIEGKNENTYFKYSTEHIGQKKTKMIRNCLELQILLEWLTVVFGRACINKQRIDYIDYGHIQQYNIKIEKKQA